MKKIAQKTWALSLTGLLSLAFFSACGAKASSSSSSSFSSSVSAAAGKTLRIYAPSASGFKEDFTSFYPEIASDSGGGYLTLKDGTEVLLESIPLDSLYYEMLDGALNTAGDGAADLFVVGADRVKEYAQNGKALDLLTEVGLTESQFADQFAFPEAAGLDRTGRRKASAYKINPGLFAYRRDLASAVFGSAEPTEVQKHFASWDALASSAALLSQAGFKMFSGYGDSLSAFFSQISAQVQIESGSKLDPAVQSWIKQTKNFTAAGYSDKTDYGSSEWLADQGPSSQVFSFFLSADQLSSFMENGLTDPDGQKASGNGLFGKWGLCAGPVSYQRGGYYLLAGGHSDNLSLVKDIIAEFCCQPAVMQKIAAADLTAVNSRTAMSSLSSVLDYFGGQKVLSLFGEAAQQAQNPYPSSYDAYYQEALQSCFKDYFNGQITEEAAEESFFKKLLDHFTVLV
jgi:hypothetical protein